MKYAIIIIFYKASHSLFLLSALSNIYSITNYIKVKSYYYYYYYYYYYRAMLAQSAVMRQ